MTRLAVVTRQRLVEGLAAVMESKSAHLSGATRDDFLALAGDYLDALDPALLAGWLDGLALARLPGGWSVKRAAGIVGWHAVSPYGTATGSGDTIEAAVIAALGDES